MELLADKEADQEAIPDDVAMDDFEGLDFSHTLLPQTLITPYRVLIKGYNYVTVKG
jgi:hypothetical protein